MNKITNTHWMVNAIPSTPSEPYTLTHTVVIGGFSLVLSVSPVHCMFSLRGIIIIASI